MSHSENSLTVVYQYYENNGIRTPKVLAYILLTTTIFHSHSSTKLTASGNNRPLIDNRMSRRHHGYIRLANVIRVFCIRDASSDLRSPAEMRLPKQPGLSISVVFLQGQGSASNQRSPATVFHILKVQNLS